MSARTACRRALLRLANLARLLGWSVCALALIVGAVGAVVAVDIPLKLIAAAAAAYWLVIGGAVVYVLRAELGHSWAYIGRLARRVVTDSAPGDREAIAEAICDQLRNEPPEVREHAVEALPPFTESERSS